MDSIKIIIKNIFKIILGIVLLIFLFLSFFLVMGAIATFLLEINIKHFLIIGGLIFITLMVVITKIIKIKEI